MLIAAIGSQNADYSYEQADHATFSTATK